MRTKVIYVLTSSSEDFYMEQTLISVFSLKRFHPDANVMIVTDNDSYESFIGNREIIKEYAEILQVEVPKEFDKLRRSRYLKTHLRELVEGDFLFIDTDTVIVQPLDEIDFFDYEMAAVADKHVKMSMHPKRLLISKQLEAAGTSLKNDDFYINSGLLYVKDTILTHKLYNLWHTKWLEIQLNHPADQPSLAWANEQLDYPIKIIDGIWNCQVFDNGLCYLVDSKIIHYFASSKDDNGNSAYLLYNKSTYQRIRNYGGIPDDIKDLIMNPLKAFSSVCRIVASNDIDYLEGDLHIIYKKNKVFYNVIEKIAVSLMNFFIKTHLSRLIKK